ncbi:hypothetical protein Mgra_00004587 [Meloidogyne graminicola]|uniref:Integrase catalytic domain-containing protein n=1 Tax=Meloidogyne graminicola TaxID=189291 RepID=A0A8S9ZRW2_9BILA|nr:hypothetical protein Mgra_00004587 [Meloidogyne graminicola]
MENYSKLLHQLYNDPESPAAFSGVDRLWKEAKKVYKNIPKSIVQNYLEGHRTYTLMRPKFIHFKRAKTIPTGFMTDVQVDLADFQKIARHNKGNRYLLIGIDVLSKRIFGVPVKSKNGENMVIAFEELLKQMPMKPHRIFSDKGTEFKNSQMKEFFQKEDIHKTEPTHSIVKASLAERAIRNIKQRIYRYFAQNQTLDWVQVLPNIIDGINKAKSRVHRMRPIDVNFDNAQDVWNRLYGNQYSKKRTKSKLKKGDFVRMSVGKGMFEKGYIPNWSDEILQVEKVKDNVKPIRYKVKDEKGEKFKGSFYKEELSRVRKDADTEYRIEKIVRKRKRDDGTYDLLVNNVPDYPENRPNKFRVHLPKPLYFSGEWVCGLHSISYPYSWPSTIGTLDEQWIDIHFLDNKNKARVIRLPVPKGSHATVEELHQFLTATLKHQSQAVLSKPLEEPERLVDKPTIRRPKRSGSPEGELKTPSPTKEDDEEGELRIPSPMEEDEEHDRTPSPSSSDPLWTEEDEMIITQILGRPPSKAQRVDYLPNMPVLRLKYGKLKKDKIDGSVQKQIIDSINLSYLFDFERFKVTFNHPKIKYLSFSNQLGYVLGFENPNMVQKNEVAKYGCDLRGGFSSFAVYSKGLTENMIIGNSLSSLLRVVSVAGATPGQYYEKIYDSPIYARVMPKEVNEIEIELRTMDNGRLVPFEFGTVLLVLIFKKVINF